MSAPGSGSLYLLTSGANGFTYKSVSIGTLGMGLSVASSFGWSLAHARDHMMLIGAPGSGAGLLFLANFTSAFTVASILPLATAPLALTTGDAFGSAMSILRRSLSGVSSDLDLLASTINLIVGASNDGTVAIGAGAAYVLTLSLGTGSIEKHVKITMAVPPTPTLIGEFYYSR